nr:endo-1,4-beta-xylanase [uncultured bacterium]
MKKLFLSALALSCVFSTQALAGLADNAAKFVGNITTRGQVRSDFGTYWNQITAENECKWASIEGTRGNYNWSGCDAAYNWAKQNGGHFKFHALVWGSQYPNWLNGLSVEETKKAITAWFDAVAKRYPDLEMIDVVNEAIRTGNGQYHSGYGNNNNIIPALGGDNNGDYNFVTTAFKMARERWPNAILIYNDYNTVQWQKNEGIQLIQTILKNGAPVDAYGLQAHDMMSQGGGAGGTGGGGTCLNINTLKSVIEEIWTKTQIPMYISEYDIATSDDNVQKQCYQEQISYFMENEHIAGITLWGYIYGATWTTDGNSGIIRDGQDRPAMTWLKEYLSKNTGNNTTGLTGGEPVEPVPQAPYNGSAGKAPGKIEAEHFDIAGVGKGNNSYSDGNTENQGDANFRVDEPVDIYLGGTGMVLGYTEPGEWLEYTVNFDTEGAYSFFANVSAGNEGSSLNLYIDDDLIIEELAIPQTGEENWDTYEKVGAQIAKISRGEHVVKLEVVGGYFNIDYLTFVAGANAEDPEPNTGIGGGTQEDPSAIAGELHLNVNKLGQYDVFDMQGVYIGRLSAYSMEQAVSTVKHSDFISAKGTYFIKSKNTGKVQAIRLVR